MDDRPPDGVICYSPFEASSLCSIANVILYELCFVIVVYRVLAEGVDLRPNAIHRRSEALARCTLRPFVNNSNSSGVAVFDRVLLLACGGPSAPLKVAVSLSCCIRVCCFLAM
ncbi:unnamed protein product [Ectocarpus sp. 13 AM-2016]